MKITPAIKGLITGTIMIGLLLYFFYANIQYDSNLQYSVYAVYALGIIWTVYAFYKSEVFVPIFGKIFNQGFRCFIIVTLMISLFYGVFNMMHPEFTDESAKMYKEQLVKEQQKTPIEIENEIKTFRKQYTLRLVSGAIFGYLIIGVAVTAGASVLVILITRKN